MTSLSDLHKRNIAQMASSDEDDVRETVDTDLRETVYTGSRKTAEPHARTDGSTEASPHVSTGVSTQGRKRVRASTSKAGSKPVRTNVSASASPLLFSSGQIPMAQEIGLTDAQFLEYVRAVLPTKRQLGAGNKATVDMTPELSMRAARYGLEHGKISTRQLVIELLDAFLTVEGY